MQTANVMVALGGDMKNTVPKNNVTAAEIAVLQAIHGHEAVFDIQPLENVPMNNRAERERLRSIYGNAKDGHDNSIFEMLFPGVAARVFENLNELNLVPEQFAASARVAAPEPEELVEDEEVPEPVKPAKAAKAPAKKTAKKAAEVAYDDDGELDELPADDSVLD